jgi:hypothetical protein
VNDNTHQRARRLIDRLAIEGLAASDREWLDSHVSSCEECALLQQATDRAIGAFHAISAFPRPAVVSAVRRQVHARAYELRRQAAIQRPIWLACALSWCWMLITTPWFWRAFAWLGSVIGAPSPVWQAAFIMAWFLPATVLAAVVAWKRTHHVAQSAVEAKSEWYGL